MGPPASGVLENMAEHRVTIDGQRIHSPRLELRPWSTQDAEAALAIYGSEQVDQVAESRHGSGPGRGERWSR